MKTCYSLCAGCYAQVLGTCHYMPGIWKGNHSISCYSLPWVQPNILHTKSSWVSRSAHDPQTIFSVSSLAQLCRGHCGIYLGSAAGTMSEPPSVQRLILEDKHRLKPNGYCLGLFLNLVQDISPFLRALKDFLNSYFMEHAERIRTDADNTVLVVPKDGPASADMVVWPKTISQYRFVCS